MAKLGEAHIAGLQRLVASSQQKFTVQIHRFVELCWDKCVCRKARKRLDSCTESCLSSCVDRFFDTTAITGRFAQIVQKGG